MKSDNICICLCLFVIAYTQIIGFLINDGELKGMGLIALILLVVVLITKLRGKQ